MSTSLLFRNTVSCKLLRCQRANLGKLLVPIKVRCFANTDLRASSNNSTSEKNKEQQVGKLIPKEILISGAGGFVSLSILSALHYGLAPGDITTILASFGPTSMMIFVFPEAHFSQPKNVIGGHLISAFWGICTTQLVNLHLEAPWLAGPTAVGGAIILMLSLKLAHPAAAGTALLAALGSRELQDMGFQFLIPTSIGASILVLVGVVFHKLIRGRSYPKYWF